MLRTTAKAVPAPAPRLLGVAQDFEDLSTSRADRAPVGRSTVVELPQTFAPLAVFDQDPPDALAVEAWLRVGQLQACDGHKGFGARHGTQAREDAAQVLEEGGRIGRRPQVRLGHDLDERRPGAVGPALRSKQFLSSATDAQMELLVSVGVPGSQMSAFSQDHGGPLTSEQIKAVVTYVRSWEATAPDRPDWRTAFIGGTSTTATGSGSTSTTARSG